MYLDSIKVKNTNAPKMTSFRFMSSRYRDLFDNLKPGQWFTINSGDKVKLQAAAQSYVKGRYSLYKHPTMDCKYVFKLNK
jgi:hypothetical protein